MALVTKIFVTKTISYKILLYLVTKFLSLKQLFVAIFVTKKFVTKTYFLFLLYDFNCFYICADFLLVAFRGFTFSITRRHMRTSSVGSNYIMLHFLYCYKTSWVIVCITNNYCMERVWIRYLFYFLLVECMDRFFINVLLK